VTLSIGSPRIDEAALVLGFVREAADYAKLLREVDATEAMIAQALFGPRPQHYCDIAEWEGTPAGISTWSQFLVVSRPQGSLPGRSVRASRAWHRQGIARQSCAPLRGQ
jgi:hypothetical protein